MGSDTIQMIASAAKAAKAATATVPWMVPTAGGAEQLDPTTSQWDGRLLPVSTGSYIIHGWTTTLIQTTTAIHESASAIADAVQPTARPTHRQHKHVQSTCPLYAQRQLVTSSFTCNVLSIMVMPAQMTIPPPFSTNAWSVRLASEQGRSILRKAICQEDRWVQSSEGSALLLRPTMRTGTK